ncbi:hypothetical protein HanXRQr2_Chr17g0821321 [Helianthus annuus]|uniref:Uncharacterized protein n=1 Tax=Helianthus annuus TaxID=4232 RepID=A0A9K3GWK2_HELAN|nr:hypothetical protein HanXRQr2_Chr17g0821321 [Helianthus annuus]KAJ0814490.1 hypothetical protein HanPSC8_Chr17g0786301 [Helianthus annuus]
MIGYDPSLLFRCFFRLTKNDDWVTFEISQVDVCLTSSMVTTFGSWKDRFFWISESIVPFRLVWRHPYPDRDLVLVRDDQVMFALDFIKSDDTSDVVFADAEATTGEDVVVRGTEHRFEGSGYVNVSNVKGFTKVVTSKVSTRRSSCCLINTADQPSASELVELSNDIEASDDLEVGVGENQKRTRDDPWWFGG